MAVFERTHARVLENMLDASINTKCYQMLTKLANLRIAVDDGMSEAEANCHANRLIMDSCSK